MNIIALVGTIQSQAAGRKTERPINAIAKTRVYSIVFARILASVCIFLVDAATATGSYAAFPYL